MKVGSMFATYRKALSFVKRSYILQMSYKFEFFLRLFFMFFNILTYYFVAKLIGTAGMKYLEPYGGDYFSFVLIGIAFSGYLMVSLRGFSESVRDEQMMGTLEAMLVTPTDASAIITLSTLWSFIFASFRVLLYLVIGVLLGVSLAGANVLAALIILGLTIVCFSSIGILSASFIMIFKRGDPINMLFMSTSELFGGVFFPISVLPSWLQTVSHLLPMTYSLNGMRHALLQGYSLRDLAPEIGALVLFSAVLVPASLLAFRYAVRKAKMEGTLVHY
jgi:ABC-2 type transport system permease protein